MTSGIYELKSELVDLRDHVHRIHMQFRAFKKARDEAETDESVATLQLDWSENAKWKQAKAERGSYYNEDQVSLHTMYTWTTEGSSSITAMSDDTDHTASAIYASVEPVLKDFVTAGKTKINVVSDSPLSQYRNKSIFFMIKKFCEDNNVNLNWIYLECGHGKGKPDAVGAVVKRMIKSIVELCPDEAVYKVEDLLANGLQKMVPSIKLLTFSTADIEAKRKIIPASLKSVTGTAKFHHISAVTTDGVCQLFAANLSGKVAKKINI